MKAIGIIQPKGLNGKTFVKLPVKGETYNYILANKERMTEQASLPQEFQNIGLFEFDPADQFCYWQNPNDGE